MTQKSYKVTTVNNGSTAILTVDTKYYDFLEVNSNSNDDELLDEIRNLIKYTCNGVPYNLMNVIQIPYDYEIIGGLKIEKWRAD